jgi:phosphoribosylcarboxyaminoimidazole (NCAIR) mutase
MPAGVPVATVAVGSAGGTNAALLAIQILARADESLAKKLHSYKKSMAAKVAQKNSNLQKQLGK